MDFAKFALETEPYIIGLRREFHQHPELSNEEFHTVSRICEELDTMGIPYDRVGENSLGVIGRIEAGDGHKIAIRADIDALPTEEKTSVSYKSQCPGKMHACGHDAHIAMLLGAAKILKSLQTDLHGTVYLCFQPAEELSQGAEPIIAYLLEKQVEQVIGLHVWSSIDAHAIRILDGATMAGGSGFQTTVRGCGGHGSRPDWVRDPIKAACDLVLKWSAIPSNFYDVFSPSVVHTCMIQGGQSNNIFPDEVTLKSGVRCFKKGGTEQIMRQIRCIADGVSAAYHVDVDIDVYIQQEPVINTPACAQRGREVVSQMRTLSLDPETEPISASDNFYLFLQQIPGFYGFLGIRNEKIEASFPQHHSQFNMDESTLKDGAEFFVRYVMDFLGSSALR